jgi:hypothetical protein
MYGVEAFRLSQTHVQHFHRPKFESSVDDALDNVACVACADGVRLDDC